jgi:predicted alpha/beta hydrolase
VQPVQLLETYPTQKQKHDMSADTTTTTIAPAVGGLPVSGRGGVGALVARAAMVAAWTARNPRERFAHDPEADPPDRVYYRTEDGWEAPLWRYPPPPGQPGEPILMVHGFAANHLAFDFHTDVSLARTLRAAGFDVYLMEHRGDRMSIAPEGRQHSYDFDDIVTQDVPAAIARIQEITGFGRVMWLGHAMGGQLLYAHLARGGAQDIAAAITLCAPVTFEVPKSHARLAAAVARLVPEGWLIPTRALQQLIAPITSTEMASPLALDTEGPLLRGMMLHGSEDVEVGLLRQITRWLQSGTLTDRHDQLDYLAAIRGIEIPLFGVAAKGDPICPPTSARPALEALHPAHIKWKLLDEDWGHVDVLMGRRAPKLLFPELVAWLVQWRRRCWCDPSI